MKLCVGSLGPGPYFVRDQVGIEGLVVCGPEGWTVIAVVGYPNAGHVFKDSEDLSCLTVLDWFEPTPHAIGGEPDCICDSPSNHDLECEWLAWKRSKDATVELPREAA